MKRLLSTLILTLIFATNHCAPPLSTVMPTTARTTIIPWPIGINPSPTVHFPLFLLSTSASQNSSPSAAPAFPPSSLIDRRASPALSPPDAALSVVGPCRSLRAVNSSCTLNSCSTKRTFNERPRPPLRT